MSENVIRLTVIPGSRQDRQLRCWVRVSFKPDPAARNDDAVLAVLRDWPAWVAGRLAKPQLLLRLAGGPAPLECEAALVTPPPSAEAWQAVFGELLRGWQPSSVEPGLAAALAQRGREPKLVTLQQASCHQKLRDYTTTMAKPSETEQPDARKTAADLFAEVRQTVAALRPKQPPRTNSDPGSATQLARLLTWLSGHPLLEQRLGLVLEYKFDHPALPAAECCGTVALALPQQAGYQPELPQTVFWADRGTFRPCPFEMAKQQRLVPAPGAETPPGLRVAANGLVELGDGFSVIQVDTTKASHRHGQDVAPSTTIDPALALSTSGLSLVYGSPPVASKSRNGDLPVAVAHLRADMARQTMHLAAAKAYRSGGDKEPPPPVTLVAEDLMAGYAVDVWDGEQWRSLCRRQVGYLIGKHGQPPVEEVSRQVEELGVAPVVLEMTAAARDGQEVRQYLVNDSLFTWTGWSLTAPRPGVPLNVDTRLVGCAPVAASVKVVEPVVPPGSLPRLRYGQQYALRLRPMYLGQVEPAYRPGVLEATPPELSGTCVSTEHPYARFEPVQPPAFVPYAAEPDGSVRQELVLLGADGRAPAPVGGHLVAPVGDEQTAELYGLLDNLAPAESYALMAARQKVVALPDGGVRPLGLGEEAHPEQRLNLPYLPDPFAGGVVVTGAPGQKIPQSFELAFGDQWYDPEGWHVHLLPTTDRVASSRLHGRAVEIYLPAGEEVTLSLCSLLTKEALERLGVWHWLGKPTATSAVRRLTPARDLRLVHAVQRPLAAPTIASINQPPAPRSGDAEHQWHLMLQWHAASSGSVEARGVWDDYTDDGHTDMRSRGRILAWSHFRQQRNSRPVLAPSKTTPDQSSGGFDAKFHSPDSRYCLLTIVPAALSRFASYFSKDADCRREQAVPETLPSAPQTSGAIATVRVLATCPPPPPAVAYIMPLLGSPSDSTHVSGFRIFLRRPWLSSGPGEQLAVLMADEPDDKDPEFYWSHWGLDPVWPAGQSLERLRAADLVAAESAVGSVAQPGLPKALAVPLNVKFDSHRDLWFADLHLSPSAYRPFVRLALARYQLHAVAGCQLSTPVWTDFHQLAPGRLLTVNHDGLVSLSGGDAATPAASGVQPPTRTIQARLVYFSETGQWLGDVVPPQPADRQDLPAQWQLDPILAADIERAGYSGRTGLLVQESEVWASPSEKAGDQEALETIVFASVVRLPKRTQMPTEAPDMATRSWPMAEHGEAVKNLWGHISAVVDELDPDKSNEARRNIKLFMLHVAWHEGKKLTTRRQDGGGPGRSFYQFEPNKAYDGVEWAASDDDWMASLVTSSGSTKANLLAAQAPLKPVGAKWPNGNLIEALLLSETHDRFATYLARFALKRISEKIPLPDAPNQPHNWPHADYWARRWKVVFTGQNQQELIKIFTREADEVDQVLKEAGL